MTSVYVTTFTYLQFYCKNAAILPPQNSKQNFRNLNKGHCFQLRHYSRLKSLNAKEITVKTSHTLLERSLAESSADDYSKDGGPGKV